MISSGAQIRAARAALRLTQPQLAEMAGLHAKSVSYWEARDDFPKREPHAVARMREALSARGVVILRDPPGVAFRKLKDAAPDRAALDRAFPPGNPAPRRAGSALLR